MKNTLDTRECTNAMLHMTHGSCVVKSVRPVRRYSTIPDAPLDVECNGVGRETLLGEAGVAWVFDVQTESATERITFMTEC